jgi:glucose/arabinose dehydrogenase
VIEEYARSSDPDEALEEPVSQLIRLGQPAPNHNGGSLEFSPADGYLYIALGDNGYDGIPESPENWYGKIHRIDVATTPYQAPTGNHPGGLPEVWDIGLRNPWRIAFDPCTGDLFIADVGHNDWEEVNVESAGDGHHDYGWRQMEGMHCSSLAPNCDPTAGYTLPVVEYPHDETNCRSVTGGVVYRGQEISWLRGHYFYGDFCTGQIWSFRWTGDTVADHVEHFDANVGPFGVASFGHDNGGNVYVVDYAGGLYRLIARR